MEVKQERFTSIILNYPIDSHQEAFYFDSLSIVYGVKLIIFYVVVLRKHIGLPKFLFEKPVIDM
jgi:hypothetical protein